MVTGDFGLNFVAEIRKIERNVMNFKTIIAAAFMAATSLLATAQTHSTSAARAAHNRAHKEQLANVKNRMDRDVINGMVKHDIERREGIAGLSAESSKMIGDLLNEAQKHIGKKYVHGTHGPNTFDCSGFTSYVYKQFGYNISPGSRIQYTQGTPVARNDLRKGDLVFFTSRSSGKNVGHVGIVWEADNEKGTFKFIHASVRGVKISDFEGYYVPRYVGAKRIITK